MKSLELKARNVIDGNVSWHDAYVLQLAIERIVENKSFSKMALWLSVAGKIQDQLETDDDFRKRLVPDKSITIELRNIEARKLWQELCKLEPKQFGRNSQTGQLACPNPGILFCMLRDIADQLGYELPLDEDDEDDE